MGIFEVFAQSC